MHNCTVMIVWIMAVLETIYIEMEIGRSQCVTWLVCHLTVTVVQAISHWLSGPNMHRLPGREAVAILTAMYLSYFFYYFLGGGGGVWG